LTKQNIDDLIKQLLTEEQLSEWQDNQELNLSYMAHDNSRYRINIYQQRDNPALVFRPIKTDIPSFTDLGLPEILQSLIMSKHGLILFVGSTGAGKSTSMAALLDHRNEKDYGHIITVEDPIEYVYQHKKCLISQREVGVDTHSFSEALKNTLRQAPDVIQIGEIRDAETMEYALNFAETGHLVISTLHANNADQAIERIVSFFPSDMRQKILLDLSLNLRAIVSQRMLTTIDDKKIAAFELLISTARIQELIKQGQIEELKETMSKSNHEHMFTFDQYLLALYTSGKISKDMALAHADSETDLSLKIKLSSEKPDDDELNLR
jgi:twitching motility protein PilU